MKDVGIKRLQKKLFLIINLFIFLGAIFRPSAAGLTSPLSSTDEPLLDLFNQKGGYGINQTSDTFAPDEIVILFAYLTFNQEPVEGKLVAFQVINPLNVTVAYRSALTSASGIAVTNFTIPYAVPPEEVIGLWKVVGTASVAEITVIDMLYFYVKGAMIDVFTQKEPYSGRGPNQPSDAFAPQEEVILYAYVTYDLDPVEGKSVAFEVVDPMNNSVIYRVENTNASGIAEVRFRMPTNATFGEWYVIGTVSVLERTLWDTLTFKVGWLVGITEIQATNVFGESAMAFRRGESVYFNVTIDNITFIDKKVTLTITVYDVVNCSIGHALLDNWLIPPGNINVIFEFQVPMWAFLGTASAYFNAYTSIPISGGVPYSPETSLNFIINP
jgi:hypothetical protein